jgi:hypothetical protein
VPLPDSFDTGGANNGGTEAVNGLIEPHQPRGAGRTPRERCSHPPFGDQSLPGVQLHGVALRQRSCHRCRDPRLRSALFIPPTEYQQAYYAAQQSDPEDVGIKTAGSP